MALNSLIGDGHGQIELNQVAFRRDGRVEAQCALDPEDFASDLDTAENGMFLIVDKKNGTLKLPKAADLAAGSYSVFGLNYSTEHLYDERNLGLKNFKLTINDFYPRVGFVSVGDRYTTNTVVYDGETYADNDALKEAIEAGKVYAIPSCDENYAGFHEIVNDSDVSSITSPIVLEAVKYYTMPDGQPGIKFLVVKA